MSRKLPILYSKLLYKTGNYFLWTHSIITGEGGKLPQLPAEPAPEEALNLLDLGDVRVLVGLLRVRLTPRPDHSVQFLHTHCPRGFYTNSLLGKKLLQL